MNCKILSLRNIPINILAIENLHLIHFLKLKAIEIKAIEINEWNKDQNDLLTAHIWSYLGGYGMQHLKSVFNNLNNSDLKST